MMLDEPPKMPMGTMRRRLSMEDLRSDPAQERAILYAAIDTLHRQWGKAEMAEAYTDLHAAVARAAQALSVLKQQNDKKGVAFQIHVLGLAAMVMVAREELQRAERFALNLLGQRRARKETSRKVLDTVLPGGTIISCPCCGLYIRVSSKGTL